MTWFHFADRVLTLRLQIQAGSKTEKIDGIYLDRLKLKIQAPAIDGKANNYLIKFLAGQFGVPKTRVEIIRGQHSKVKTIRITDPKLWPDWFNDLSSVQPAT